MAKPRPALDEADQLWRACAGTPGLLRLEDAFTKALARRGFDRGYGLGNLVAAYAEANRLDDVVALSRAVLASGAEFPTNWLPSLADALIALGRLAEAEPVVREVIGSIESYKSEMLVTAMRYERARGNTAAEQVCYHAGKRWFTNFAYAKKRAATFGKAPRDLPTAFATWLEGWIAASHWAPEAVREIGHWLVWFDEIESPVTARYRDVLVAERDRRNALYRELEKARDNAAGRELLARAKQFHGDIELVQPLAHALIPRAPQIAHALLLHAIASEGNAGYRYPTGERVVGVVNLQFLTLSEPALRDQVARVYDLSLGYQLVRNATLIFNLACLAARLGRRAPALRYLRRALTLGYDAAKARADGDLASLRGDPELEAVFAAR